MTDRRARDLSPAGLNFADLEMNTAHGINSFGKVSIRQRLQRIIVNIQSGYHLVFMKPVFVFIDQIDLIHQNLNPGGAIGVAKELFRRK